MRRNGWHAGGTTAADAHLRRCASHFSIIENATTHFTLPGLSQASSWVAQTPPWSTMNVKAFATLSEHRTERDRLPVDLRDALPAGARGKRHVYPKDLGDEVVREIAARFRQGIEALRASGRLGVVLFEYPVWFPRCRENEQRLAHVQELVPGCRLAVEFRNSSWMNDSSAERTLAVLRDAGLAYVCVDAQQGTRSSVPPVARATSDAVAVVRFHGRAEGSSWTEGGSYCYSLDELAEWVPKIRRLADEAATVHVIMTNGDADSAAQNAHQMVALLEKSTRAAPARTALRP
jgi:uncharacterized protein YecE (DUF72 family)